ncbi:hypothetical protein [Cellulosilyticum sp. I15G10I2]|uniref:hypothetical protein n=1 Tax=Cellulosilyticum sp. I15G10I2 TaxID=1892843 RepID=UPI00085BB37E|nr:hypothetical protein [Cellulosilyticum sp. I15G10I2]
MKRRVALLLTIIMLLSSLNVLSLSAAPAEFDSEFNYRLVTDQGLLDGLNGIEPNNNGLQKDEAGVKWDMKSIGKYTLSYYVQQSITNKVDLEFDVAASGQVTMRASLSTTPATYSFRTYNAGTWAWQTTSPALGVFQYNNLQLDAPGKTVGFEQQQLSFTAGSLPIRLQIKGQTIHISTQGIQAGYITPFELTYDSGSIQKTGTLTTLKGLEKFTVTPTHLTSGPTLESKHTLQSGDETLGSRPGVKVSFDKPKAIIGGSSVFTEVEGSDISAVLNMSIATSASGGESGGSSNALTLNFSLGSTIPANPIEVKRNGTTHGQVQTSGSTMSIYVNQSTDYLDNDNKVKVIEWDKLDSSMLINAGLSFSGGVMSSLDIGQRTFSPENNGHTYLEYSAFRASESQVGIWIKPYKVNGAVTYTLKQGTLYDNVSPLVYHNYPGGLNNSELIYIYVPNTAETTYFQVEADIGGKAALQSQIIQFSINNETPPPPVSKIQSINNIYAVPGDNLEDPPQAIGFDITWQAPQKSELEAILAKGAIYYELSFHQTKKESGATRPASDSKVIKIFKVSKDLVSGKIVVEAVSGEAGSGQYIESTGNFLVEEVVLKSINETGWEFIEVQDNRFNGNDYTPGNEMTMPAYTVPKVYYASIRAIFDPSDIGAKIAVSQDSNDISVPLDTVIEIIPTPTKLESINRSVMNPLPPKINYDIEIDKINITNYVKKMLKPAALHLDETTTETSYKGIYEIFLYQKNDKKTAYTDQDFVVETGVARYKHAADTTILLTDDEMESLRNGGVLPIVYTVDSLGDVQNPPPVKLSLEGLDANQVYYVKTRVRLDVFKDLQPKDSRYSIFSKILSFTTTALPQPPKPEDKVPPAPQDFWVESQPNNTTAILKWAEAKLEKDEDITKLYYEIARATDVKLNENEQRRQLNIEALVSDNNKVVGFRTSEPNLMAIGGNPSASGWYQVEPVQSSDSLRLEDNNLSPNTIYYYYVRTVCIVNGTMVRSEWIMVPVTTHPVERPIKLQVETPSKYTYDPKTETVISFLAPIPGGANVPNDYEFEIAVQGETDDNYRLDYSRVSVLSIEDPSTITSGYRHFVYKLYNLKPGRRYDIKVRVVDKTSAKPENGDYPRSLYSEKVVARTEFDQDDQDKDNKFSEYLKRFEDEVEKLRRKAYWEVEGENRFSAAYKYKASYINAELAVKSAYDLQTLEGMNRLTYYLPATMLNKASDLNVIINAVLGTESISIRPYTLTADNEAIKEAVAQKNQKKIKDYYIKLDFIKMAAGSKVNGEDTLSPEICIDMDIIYIDQEDMILEDDIMIALNKLVDRERIRIITRLENELSKGTINDESLKDIIDSAIANIKEDHQSSVKSILKKQTDKTVAVYEIEKPILITSILDSYSVNGYYLEGTWSSVEVLQANGGYTIEAHQLGIYIFTGKTGIANTIPSLAAYQNMISKYNLTDFFVLDAYMIKTGATKRQVYGAVARILGAKRNTDYMEYLKNRGIKGITSIGQDKVIRQDEAIYIIMQAYEKVYNRPITSVQIKNRQSVTNIGAFQTQYRAYVYAGVELNIVNNPNRQVLPSKSMSVEETLKILSKVALR